MSSIPTLPPLDALKSIRFLDDNGQVSFPWMQFLQTLHIQQSSQNTGIATNGTVASNAQSSANAAQSSADAAQGTANSAITTIGEETARAEAAEAALGVRITAETNRAEAAEALLSPIASPTFTGTVTEPVAVLTSAAPTVASGQVGIGGTVSGTATSGAATLPGNPVGFWVLNIAGIVGKIPYYAT